MSQRLNELAAALPRGYQGLSGVRNNRWFWQIVKVEFGVRPQVIAEVDCWSDAIYYALQMRRRAS